MANIIKTSVGGAGTRPVTEIVLTATNDLTYEPGAGHVLILRNPTAASIDCVLRGADSTTENFPGAPFISVAGGYSTTVPAGAVRAIPLDTVAAYLKGQVTVTGAGLVAVLMRAVNGRGARSIFNDPPAAVPGEIVVPTAPVPFPAGDWSLATGLEANQLVVNINALPANGGSQITAIQYSANGGTWTALPGGAGTGPRTLSMPAAGTSYGIRLRAVNAVGNSTPSDTKTATSGAEGATVPSYQRMVVIGASQERDLFGDPSLTTQSAGGTSDMGFPVYSVAVSGTGITDTNGARKQIADALAQWPTPGQTLFLIGSVSGNPITAVIAGGLSDAEADAIAADYNSMLDLFGTHLPHVHALQTSFRSYTNHGFSGSQLFDNPDLGSANLNDRLTPIFQARLNQSLCYANGDSMVDWYDLTRNNYATWIRDGIHHTTSLLPTIRQTLTSRLRAALEGNPPAAIAPAARPALSVLIASVSAPSAAVGTAYSYSAGRLFNLWDAPYTVTGLPAWATLSRDALGQFTITGTPDATASLSIAINATVAGVTRTSTISLSVSEAGTAVYPLTIINFHNGASTAVGNNNLNGSSSSVELSLTTVLDVDGGATGLTFQITAPQGAAIGSTTDPAIGGGNTGRTNLPAYNRQLLSGQITAGFYYVTGTPILPMVLSGAVAGATYEVGIVGSRAVTDARETTLRVQGTPTTWNAAEDPPQERRVTVQADAQGRINMELEATGTSTFGYISGLSFRRLS